MGPQIFRLFEIGERFNILYLTSNSASCGYAIRQPDLIILGLCPLMLSVPVRREVVLVSQSLRDRLILREL